MKKRFLIPLIVIATPIFIGVADTSIHMAGCGFGNKGACSELDRRRANSEASREERNVERAKATAAKAIADAEAAKAAKAKAEQRAAEKQARDERQAAEEKAEAARRKARREKGSEPESWRAEAAAESCIKQRLNDPHSLRTLSSKVVAYDAKQYTVLLEYTATNAFGGRVREFDRCTVIR